MALGAEIKKRRKELGLTLAELAKMVDVSEATVQRWESGNIKTLRYGRIEVLASALQTTPMALQGWESKDDDIKEQAINALLANIAKLTPENREKLSDYLNLLIQSQR